jgi:DNA primase
VSVVDEVKERLDIVEVVQSYVPLKKAGRNYKGLCPFHSEKTPSFVVFPETGTWHCFGACGTGGDVFSFLMKRENIGFGEALRMLAQRAGVELEPRSPESTEAERRLDLLREINQAATTYFRHRLLHSDEAARARRYLEGRGLNAETLDRFQVGYALDRWDGLLNYLVDKGYALPDVAEAGLIVERQDGSGYYDRFRGRVVVPIRDHRGRTVGFGGRILGEGVPKYLNSPQTPLFDKSSVLFGLDQARAGIRTSEMAVIVEGYMDVLMAHQHGLNNVVAQMGTALTEAQLRLLKRHTQRFVLALDSDTAGNQATLRGLDVARQVMDREVVPVPTARGLIRFEDRLAADIHIVALPPGKDPDEVIRESPAAWLKLVAEAKPVMDYYFDALSADLDLATAKGKAEVVNRLGPLVAELGDQVQRSHYLQQLARMVQVDEATLWQQIRRGGGQPARGRDRAERRPPSSGQPAGRQQKAGLALDEHCLSFALYHPDLLDQADESLRACEEQPLAAEDLSRPEDRAILDAWRAWLKDGGSRQARAEFFDTLEEGLQERVEALVAAQADRPPLPEELLRSDVLDAVTRLRLHNLRREVQSLRYLLEDPEDAAAATSYGPLIIQATARIRRLQQALNERSLSGRRQQKDAAVRVPFGEES